MSQQLTDDEIEQTGIYIQELRMEIKRHNETLGRIFAKGLITSDMIAEALDKDAHENQFSRDTLKVIYNSWGGNAHYANLEAMSQFTDILKTIRSYQ